MRRVLWHEDSPSWEKEVRKRPLEDIFQEMIGLRHKVPIRLFEDAFFIETMVREYGGDPSRTLFCLGMENYGMGYELKPGNLYSFLLLKGIIVPFEMVDGSEEYSASDGNVYSFKEHRPEVRRRDVGN